MFLIKNFGDRPTLLFFVIFYGLIQALGLPYLIYKLTANRTLTLLTLFGIYFVSSNVEKIYGYGAGGFITGHQATALFFLCLNFLIYRKTNLFFAAWVFSFFMHPTTAIISLVFFFCLSSFVLDERLRLFRLIQPISHLMLLVAPTCIGLLFFFYETNFHILPKADLNAYWAMTKAIFYHISFLSTYRFHLPLIFILLAMSLYILSLDKNTHQVLRPINRTLAFLGFGVFVAYLIFVEARLSTMFAMILPLRFAVIMYSMIVVNLILIAFNKRDEWKTVVCLICLSSLIILRLHHILAQYFEPLILFAFAIPLIINIPISRKISVYILLLVITILFLAFAPSPDVKWNPTGSGQLIEREVTQIAELFQLKPQNTVKLILFGCHIALALGLCLFIYHFRKTKLLVLLTKIVVCLVFAAGIHQTVVVQYSPSDILEEINSGLYSVKENNEEVELVEFLKSNTAPDDRVFSSPRIQLRRHLPRHSSLDMDLLSLVAYMPEQAHQTIEELQNDYGIDILKESTDGHFVNSRYLIENHWIEARKRAFRAWPGYKFVVEETNIDAAAQKVIFQNQKYRVYSTKSKNKN